MSETKKEGHLKSIETLEEHYLNKFYHFLKYAEDEMLEGFETKEKIKEDWIHKWDPDEEGKGISSFAVGAERIVYALFNGKGIGQPNSSPIGSDLFFETKYAFIHIDLKTVQIRNIGDYTTSIFVGDNQNSYSEKIHIAGDGTREYKNAALPHIYKNQGNPKPCLTFFVTILYNEDNLKILNINLLCMPNGELSEIYGSDVLKAGKNPGKIRYNFSKVPNFKLLGENKKRIKVIFLDEGMDKSIKSKLSFIWDIWESQEKDKQPTTNELSSDLQESSKELAIAEKTKYKK